MLFRSTGRVRPADRDGLIAMAEVVVFPSQFEGFGAPIVEAMAIGTPVIASNATAIPEVAGDAGVVLPLSIEGWSGALDMVRSRREELIVSGKSRAAHFTARGSAEDLLVAYEMAVSS